MDAVCRRIAARNPSQNCNAAGVVNSVGRFGVTLEVKLRQELANGALQHPIARVAQVIACVYCGGEHERPADVKRCWADHQNADQADHPADQRADHQNDDRSDGQTVRRIGTDTGTGPVAAEAPTAGVPTRPTPAARPASEEAGGDPPLAVPIRRGPPELGRHVVIEANQPVPDPWAGCERVDIDRTVIAAPSNTISRLRTAGHDRVSLVISIGLDAAAENIAEAGDDREPFEVGVGHSFESEELHHLIWANSVDARGPGRWNAIDRAVAMGGSVAPPSEPGDIVDPDGRRLWVDGGPVRFTPAIDGVDVVHALQLEHGRFDVAGSNGSDAELAPDQLAAVTHEGGAARIIAPAGSGKTRVLTERARHLLTRWMVPPSALTLVAFNKRAQEEMEARTTDLPGLHVRTLNAIALAIVNGSAPFAPQRRRWRTIDEPDVRRILSGLVQTPKRLNIDPIAPWIDALSLVRLGLVEPAEAEVRYGGDVDGLVDVWPHYRAALEREGAVDFDDQIYRALEVLLTQPDARSAAQRACRVLLVDEFQDLTPAHLLLIRLLAAPGGAVFGVGDDDQTIYGYNGADPAWLIDFTSWFPNADSHPLEVNYRCPAGVVEVADRLLRHNRRRVDKTIRAGRDGEHGWEVLQSDDPVEASLVAVRDAIAVRPSAGDVAVLTRVNATLVPIQVALTGAGIPIAGGVGGEFLERTAIRAALSWLRLARGSSFSASDIGEALRRPSRGLSPRLRDWAGEQRDLDGLERLAARLTNERDATKVSDFGVDLARLSGLVRRGATAAEVLDALIDQIGLGGAVATLDQGRHGMNRSAQGDDLLALRQLARLHPDVASFEGWLRDQLMTRRDPAGVVLSTVHRVKGQEWPRVVVHLVDVDQYPHRLAEEIEEERRLLHVAITRCRDHVTIVSGARPSPFVDELTTEPPEHLPEPTPRQRSTASAPTKRAAPDHPLLDRGAVMAVTGLVLVDQGHEWVVTDLEPESAVARRGEATRRFRIGAKVETSGKQRGVLSARSGDVDEVSVIVFDRLRSFRDGARDGKPAYTVFDDKTLAAIATALPVDQAELARVKGVGPAKLDRYGDDVLALIAAATSVD